MNTLHLSNSEQDIEQAAAVLRMGGLVAMPTETVYGLAANALDGKAVRRIFAAKGRPMDNPLIVHVADVSDIARLKLVSQFPDRAQRLADAFWPGPLTIIMKKGAVIPDEVSAGLNTVAIRIPSHPDARRLIAACGLPLAAPSANTSGKPSPTTARHVADDMDGRIEAILDGGSCTVGVESTVITLAEGAPRILRPGVITREEIEAVIGEVEIDKAVLNRLEHDEKASSPGMKYKHYAPRAKVVLLRGDEEHFISYVNRCHRRGDNTVVLSYDELIDRVEAPTIPLGKASDLKDQARRLFDALRTVDDEVDESATVYAPCPSAQGVGMALYNRLIRAAAFEVINLPRKRVIGLTGQTGAGKSEVARMLREFGAAIISADEAARLAVEDADVKAALCAAFGDVLNPDRTLNRRLTAQIAFKTPENRDRLNRITHPRILQIMLDWADNTDADIVIFDAPQLFEAGADRYCDHIVAVLADRDHRMARLTLRDGLSEDEIALRMNAQYDEAFFRNHADSVIENNGTIDELRRKVRTVYERLLNHEQTRRGTTE